MPGTDPHPCPERRSRPTGRSGVHPAGRAASLTVGIALAVGAPLWWFASDHSPAVVAINPGAVSRLAQDGAAGSVGGGVPAGGKTGSSAGEATSRGGGSATSGESAAPVPVTGVGGSVVLPVTGLRPVRVRIPAIAVEADVRAVGVAPDGQVAIPADIDDAGWFRWGSAPGSSTGSVVLVGHLDSAEQPGLGAFAYLRTLAAGAIVDVTTANGRVWSYRVVAKESIVKSRLPLDDLFSRDGRPRLTLVTCGGSFDPATASYDSAVVVTAVPVLRR